MSKKKKNDADAEAPAAGGGNALVISIAAHPRARASIRKIRARTAIAAFAIVLIMSHRSGVPGQEAVLRALLAGLLGNLAGWGCAVAVWRQLMLGELRRAPARERRGCRCRRRRACRGLGLLRRRPAVNWIPPIGPTDRTVPPVDLRPLTPVEREEERRRRERERQRRRKAVGGSPEAPGEGASGIDVRV
jgi:hypothetical protein